MFGPEGDDGRREAIASPELKAVLHTQAKALAHIQLRIPLFKRRSVVSLLIVDYL